MAARFPALIAATSLLATGPAAALTFNIGNGAAQIYLRVGAVGGTVSTVAFNLSGQ